MNMQQAVATIKRAEKILSVSRGFISQETAIKAIEDKEMRFPNSEHNVSLTFQYTQDGDDDHRLCVLKD